VEVDSYGRVKVELLWDRRDLRKGNPTMWVRVSQAWAGANLGIVTLPRIGDEVLVSYLGGNPDQPIIVGRVHNALSRTPLSLPDPDHTLSIWRSRTIGGDGYNEILMDDAQGGERLWLRAEREHRLYVKGSSSVEIDGDSSVDVGGDCDVDVEHHLSVKSASFHQQTGPHEVHTTRSLHSARDELRLESDSILIQASSKIQLSCGNSHITLTPGGITITGGHVTIEGGQVKVAAQATVDIDGTLITLN
jgi:type VI secretion system secreted protein VgrG